MVDTYNHGIKRRVEGKFTVLSVTDEVTRGSVDLLVNLIIAAVEGGLDDGMPEIIVIDMAHEGVVLTDYASKQLHSVRRLIPGNSHLVLPIILNAPNDTFTDITEDNFACKTFSDKQSALKWATSAL